MKWSFRVLVMVYFLVWVVVHKHVYFIKLHTQDVYCSICYTLNLTYYGWRKQYSWKTTRNCGPWSLFKPAITILKMKGFFLKETKPTFHYHKPFTTIFIDQNKFENHNYNRVESYGIAMFISQKVKYWQLCLLNVDNIVVRQFHCYDLKTRSK